MSLSPRHLGRSSIEVSALCLGTMTFGTQNTEAEGHAQMDCAMDHGITFFDTAELYPTAPTSAETQGRTEEIIGSWFAASGRRDEVVLATKIAGSSKHIRDGAAIDGPNLVAAVESSLKRLRTDCIDLYQLHWPNRGHYHFRRQWTYDPSGQDSAAVRASILEVLETAQTLIDAGKIRTLGLSNETTWGTTQFLAMAEAQGLPRVVTTQNEYSLLYRTFDLDFAELSHHEDVGLLAYSPLAAGILTGKYSGGQIPPGSRGSINKGLGGRMTPRAISTADAYVALAQEHGLDPVALALGFCVSRPFMTSTILGATSVAQLERALAGAATALSEEVMAGIDAVHRAHPSPY